MLEEPTISVSEQRDVVERKPTKNCDDKRINVVPTPYFHHILQEVQSPHITRSPVTTYHKKSRVEGKSPK